MDCLELPSLPKTMLHKLFSMSSSFPPPSSSSSFRTLASSPSLAVPSRPSSSSPLLPKSAPLPLPPLPDSGRTASSDLPSRESIVTIPLFRGHSEGVAKDHHHGPSPLKKAGNGSSLLSPETAEKPKPKRVRKSRASGTPRKRVKAPDADADAAAIAAGTQAEVPAPPKRRRANAKANSNGEDAQKPPPRRRNRQTANKGKPKDSQVGFASSNDPNLDKAPNCGRSDATTKSILGIYGLDTKALDLTRYMNDISLQALMRGGFKEAPCKDDVSGVADESFGKHVSSILQLLAKPWNGELSQTKCPAKQTPEGKPQKLMLDLEAAPQAEDEDAPCAFDGRTVKTPKDGNSQEAQTPFPIETLPIFPSTEFWNSLHLRPTESLESLLSQASLESRPLSSQTPARVGSCKRITDSLPPLPFSLNASQVLHENACDTYPRVSHWFKAGSPKRESPETWFCNNWAGCAQGTRPSCQVDGDNGTVRPALKEGLIDIDLNKQSPEAEAAETMTQSGVSCMKPETVNQATEVPLSVRNEGARMERVDEEATCMKEQQAKETPDEEGDGRCGNANDVKGGDDAICLPQRNAVKGEDPGEEVVDVIVSETVVDREGRQCEAAGHSLAAKAPSGLAQLSFPFNHQVPEICNDVPCSPGVQAAAQLLCKMANSSTPFHSEKDAEKKRAFPAGSEALEQRHAKAARIGGPSETTTTSGTVAKQGGATTERRKVQGGGGEGGRNKLLSQVVEAEAGAGGAEAGRRATTTTTPWPSSKSKMSRSQSERSGLVHGKQFPSRMLPFQQPLSKSPNPFTKESRGNLILTNSSVPRPLATSPPKHSPPPLFAPPKPSSSSSSFPAPRRLPKTSRPCTWLPSPKHLNSSSSPKLLSSTSRSRSSPKLLSSTSSSPKLLSSFPLQPRHSPSYSVKPSRHLLPLVADIAPAAKRLL